MSNITSKLNSAFDSINRFVIRLVTCPVVFCMGIVSVSITMLQYLFDTDTGDEFQDNMSRILDWFADMFCKTR